MANKVDYSELLPYCQTENQVRQISALIHHRSLRKAAKAVGVHERTICTMIKRVRSYAARQGHAPEHDMTHTAPDGYNVKGVSTLYGPDGEVNAQWVKTDIDRDGQMRIMREVAAALSEDIPRVKPTQAPQSCNTDLLNCYIITDYHLGALAWGEETGGDWDTDIAEQLLVDWFTAAIASAPKTQTAVLAQLGDFLHWDGLDAVTPAHKNLLDADTRFQLLVRVVIRVLRRIIAMLLKKHENVHVIMAEGNHDPASSIWLREWLHAMYEDEPRITVDTSPDPYYCVEHGKTSLFFHHGHKRKLEQIADVFVAKFRDVFGRTSHSYGHMGHLHHKVVKETNLMIVEQHRTLAQPDAFASRGGWMSGRDASVITYHKEHGEVGRVTLSPGMVQ